MLSNTQSVVDDVSNIGLNLIRTRWASQPAARGESDFAAKSNDMKPVALHRGALTCNFLQYNQQLDDNLKRGFQL